jgi:hypothetical protein
MPDLPFLFHLAGRLFSSDHVALEQTMQTICCFGTPKLKGLSITES